MSRMRVENFAATYDPFTGKSTITNPPLDEIHTGSIWGAACRKYCGNNPNAFPLALVCFYDKTHTDLHGSLACAPFICSPAFLNRDCRNDDSNYMVLYIPNLGHGKGKAKRQTSTMRLQDEHDCLALITQQIIQGKCVQWHSSYCFANWLTSWTCVSIQTPHHKNAFLNLTNYSKTFYPKVTIIGPFLDHLLSQRRF